MERRCETCGQMRGPTLLPGTRQRSCRICTGAFTVAERFRAIKYGLTVLEMRSRMAEQEGLCANMGCRRPLTPGQGTHADHDHATGRFRGFLCGPCNTALGFARDDMDVLAGLMDYLSAAKAEERMRQEAARPAREKAIERAQAEARSRRSGA